MSAIQDLIETVARLRAPGGCPWDREQTHQSICDCLVEEVAELLDTIDRGDFDHMREELGDLLLHVVMHAQMAQEEERFDFEDVAREVNDKLIRRHPHVFGDEAGKLGDSDAVIHRWDEIKAGETKRGPDGDGPFKHLPPSLPATLYTRELYKQIRKNGLEQGLLLEKNRIDELAGWLNEEQAGKLLFELAAACQLKKIDPESAARRYAGRVREDVVRRAKESQRS